MQLINDIYHLILFHSPIRIIIQLDFWTDYTRICTNSGNCCGWITNVSFSILCRYPQGYSWNRRRWQKIHQWTLERTFFLWNEKQLQWQPNLTLDAQRRLNLWRIGFCWFEKSDALYIVSLKSKLFVNWTYFTIEISVLGYWCVVFYFGSYIR